MAKYIITNEGEALYLIEKANDQNFREQIRFINCRATLISGTPITLNVAKSWKNK